MDKYIRYKINSVLFCMAQRAVQENKQKEFIQYIQEIDKNENISETKSTMPWTELSDCMGVQNRKHYYILNGK